MSDEVFIELSPVGGRQIGPFNRSLRKLRDAQTQIEAAILEGVEVASATATKLPQEGAWVPTELELSFGVKVTADAGVLVSSVSGEASMEIRVRITRKGAHAGE